MNHLAARGAVAFALLIAAGCGSSQSIVTSTATVTKSAAASAPASSTTSSSTSSSPAPAGVGSTVAVAGENSGEKLAFTLKKVIPNAEAGEFDTPSAGHYYVAAEWRVKNVGSSVFNDSMDNDLELIGANGEQYDTTIVSDSNVCQPLSQVKLAPGDFRVGCTYFEVPRRTKHLSELQFTPDSGFATDTAQFHL